MNIKLNNDICSIISNYIYKPKYQLLNWININDLNFISLSSNPYAIELLSENKDKINWDILSSNYNAIELLSENPDKINWNNVGYGVGAGVGLAAGDALFDGIASFF